VDRSTSVMIAEALRAPISRSPSQCPGSARSAASAGRLLMWNSGVIHGRAKRTAPAARFCGRRAARPDRSATCRVSSARRLPRDCTYSAW